jgi:arginine:ornithine antiporter/lysine permease
VVLPALTAVAAGLMIGSGIFMLPRRFGGATGVFDALIAWAVAGRGKFTLARVFQSLAQQKPHLDAGVYALIAGWTSIKTRSFWKQSRTAAMSLPSE